MKFSHRYLNDFLQINDGDVIVDVGCAKTFLSLNNFEKLIHLYLFECDDEFINALKNTFKPWEDKITIANKYVSDKDSHNEIRLDTFFKDKVDKQTFIKIDIKVAETKALCGLGDLLDLSNLKFAVFTYHLMDNYNQICLNLKTF